ncbi:B3 domain-containing protein Os08g0324300-like isoform X2 [Wolffia australiana]
MATGEPNFFKIILSNADTERLSLPRKFMAELKTQQLPETVELEDFADRRWPVKLKKTGSAVFLDEGWERFAAAHSLQPADFLLFSFTRGSRFTVVAFAPHGGEKQQAPPAQASSIPVTALRRSDVRSERSPAKTTTATLVMPQGRGAHLRTLRERGPAVYHRRGDDKANGSPKKTTRLPVMPKVQRPLAKKTAKTSPSRRPGAKSLSPILFDKPFHRCLRRSLWQELKDGLFSRAGAV